MKFGNRSSSLGDLRGALCPLPPPAGRVTNQTPAGRWLMLEKSIESISTTMHFVACVFTVHRFTDLDLPAGFTSPPPGSGARPARRWEVPGAPQLNRTSADAPGSGSGSGSGSGQLCDVTARRSAPAAGSGAGWSGAAAALDRTESAAGSGSRL